MRTRYFFSSILSGIILLSGGGISASEGFEKLTVEVVSVDPYIFPVPGEFSAYVVSGFVRSQDSSNGVGGVQDVCVLVSADHSAPVEGTPLNVIRFQPGVAELARLRAEYDQYSKKLVAVYMQMPELSFFRLLDELSIAEQARIFAMMKAEDLAKYLSLLEPSKARSITGLLAKQRQISAVFESAKTKDLVVFRE
ncbi:MAG: hypothetical protein AAGB06_06135 [Verrucomicrobiota bacterium]